MARRPSRARGLALLLLLTAFALAVVEACGSDHGTTQTGPDAAATGDTGAPSYDGAIPGPGTATLVGPQAFPITSAFMGAPAAGGCGGGTTVSPGIIPQVGILLAGQGLPPLLCPDAGAEPDAGAGGWIDLELSTTQASTGAADLTQSLVPGTYVIGNEGENDPDLCMLPSGSNAYLALLTPGTYDAQAIAISGTVTIDSISAGSVTGTFSVLMGGPYGETDASPPPSLSGAFNAIQCP